MHADTSAFCAYLTRRLWPLLVWHRLTRLRNRLETARRAVCSRRRSMTVCNAMRRLNVRPTADPGPTSASREPGLLGRYAFGRTRPTSAVRPSATSTTASKLHRSSVLCRESSARPGPAHGSMVMKEGSPTRQCSRDQSVSASRPTEACALLMASLSDALPALPKSAAGTVAMNADITAAIGHGSANNESECSYPIAAIRHVCMRTGRALVCEKSCLAGPAAKG
ncbi:hypothetical protein OKW41_002905 [Paraburkholderia sp. UCT70]